MTGKGGAAGGSYFSELGKVLGCHMPKGLEILIAVVFCKECVLPVQ